MKIKLGDLSSSLGYIHPNHLPRKKYITDGGGGSAPGGRGWRWWVKIERKMGSHVCYLAKVNNDNIKLRKTDCLESFMMETNGKPVIYF